MDTKGFDELRSKMSDLMDIERKAEFGRARAEADGWRKVSERRLKHIAECESALAKRNELIAELEKQVADLRAKLANVKQPTERERQILDMWPRFEDGEYVWFGDSVEHDGTTETVQGFKLYRCGPAFLSVVGVDTEKWLRIEDYESVKRPVQSVLDAEGVEIKVGDTVYELKTGEEYKVERVFRGTTYPVVDCTTHMFEPDQLTHTRPDSWERLEEDARKGVCEYAGAYRKSGTIDAHACDGCRFDNDGSGPTCEQQMALDVIRRAKALAGVEAGE